MNDKLKTALISSVIGIGIIIFVAAGVEKNDHQGYGALEVLGAMIIEFVVMLVAGTILASNQKTRPIGHGLLLGMLITMVIGFGICSSV